MRRSLFSVVPALAVAAIGLAGLTAPTATASPAPAPTKGTPAVVAHGTGAPSSKVAAVPVAPLQGYTQVTSAQLVDAAGVQTSGSVSCPTGTKVVGGGAVISSSSLSENLNGSLPLTDGKTWRVYVNNASATNGTFSVYATCAKRVEGYSVVLSDPTPATVGVQTAADADCPTGTAPLGGGGDGTSNAVTVNLNSSYPTATGWRVDLNNASTTNDTAYAVVVCGVPPNAYKQVVSATARVNAGTQGSATVSCPAGRTVLSGGARSASSLTSVNLNSSEPTSSTTWKAYENNGSSTQTTLRAYAVCVKTL